MRIEVTVPNLPESVSDAVLLDWHKRPGDPVLKSDNLIDLETDKVVLEVPVPENGVLLEILRHKGDVVVSGELLAVIDTEAKAAATAPVAAVATPAAPVPEPPKPSAPPPAAAPETRPEFPPTLSPAVRRMLAEHDLDPAAIQGTGREGRLTREDVQSHLDHRKAAPAQPAAEPARPAPAPATRPGDRRVPMTRLRARIAERLIDAQRSTATLTTFNEVNLKHINDLRKRYRDKFEQAHKVKLGYMSFFVKAAVEALKRYPIVNSSVEGNDIVYHDYYDIGLAVSTDRGLVVPVLRDADQKDFADIEKAVVEFSKRARDGKLTYEELNGGTFTITNGGIFGSMLSTPILNPPQSAILGMHAIKDRPVVEDGEIVVRPMIYLALSYDHRIIDGRDAVSCLYTIKELLEDPGRLLLGV
ncbi:2-oxoglutarate dehydrogenase complex dihydrolipoyllysine-residue succinyltransferase [Methylomagnum ishizawai]|uniref:2-oxoglutarate dehydrogenase complex dihydrolipoyllysine-residue succinyltransferase n=1 Tax=Methylomagnum ishizawai TaxID=1760988 RepID=UPI001C33B56F|nr:2-oxoglutarate dehydrogenase complex dihydrolipoyllysine-residue succinyltransferase [Methylomagnum ishizawai]BBL75170.1 dihydrolipoyllysine-residue succinyltransferase component of 2-oxoglutarate dehydrogenase complex [Methylomagnum ishizawai]